MKIKKILTSILTLILIPIMILGCTQNGTLTSTTAATTPNTSSTPTEPFDVEISFPDGAPPDQTALLTVTVKSNYPAFEDLYLFVDLPEGLELVSGELSWNGSIQPNEQVTAIEAIIKSIKIGDNWKITATVPLLPVNGEENNARYHYYISISENSSTGQMNYPINDSPGTPPVSVTTAESQTFLLPDPAADPPLTIEPEGESPIPPSITVPQEVNGKITEAAAYHAQVPPELFIISPEGLGTHAGGTASGEIPLDEDFNFDGGFIPSVPPFLF